MQPVENKASGGRDQLGLLFGMLFYSARANSQVMIAEFVMAQPV